MAGYLSNDPLVSYSSIVTGEAKSFLPSFADFPNTYELMTDASGSFNPHNSTGLQSSYALSYRNPDTSNFFDSAMGIRTSVAVFDTQERAKQNFEFNTNNLERKGGPPLDKVKRYTDMPNTNDAYLLTGISNNDGFSVFEVRLIFYQRNVSAMVIILGGVTPDNLEKTVLSRVNDAKYYADIIATKIK